MAKMFLPGDRSETVLMVATVAALLLAAGLTATSHGTSRRSSPEPARTSAGHGIRIAVLGDSGTGDAAQQSVADAIVAAGPFDVIVHTGDIVYPDGDTALIPATVSGPYRQLLDSQARWVVTPGNHDLMRGNEQEIVSQFGDTLPPYRTRVGPVSFYVFNSFTDWGPQVDWLRKVAPTDAAPFKVAVAHAPAMSCSNHSSDPATRDILDPVLREFGFTLFLAGHDHNYQRFAPADGLTHIVTGGGGAGLYAVTACPAGITQVAAAESLNFVRITATATALTGTAEAPDGTVLDTFALTAPQPPTR